MLRFSALGLGIFYGFSHQRNITNADRATHAQKEYEHKAKLISDAKAEYQRKTNPQSAPKAKEEKGKGFDCTCKILLEPRGWRDRKANAKAVTSNSSGADFDLESFLHLKDGQ